MAQRFLEAFKLFSFIIAENINFIYFIKSLTIKIPISEPYFVKKKAIPTQKYILSHNLNKENIFATHNPKIEQNKI